MTALEQTVGVGFAILLFGMALFFMLRQRQSQRSLHYDLGMATEQRRYLLKQCQRRLFSSALMILLAGMLAGAMFLDYDPLHRNGELMQQVDRDAAKQEVRMLAYYVMAMLLILLAILALAVFDFWATARHGVQMQKLLLQEHHETIAADLRDHRRRRAEMN